jgi:hypothetical protein
MATPDSWEALWEEITTFFKAVSRNAAVNINAGKLRQQGKDLVVSYFRQERPKLVTLGLKPDALDAPMQALMRLVNGNNAKASYIATLKQLRKERPKIDAERELLLGVLSAKQPEAVFTSTTEVAIYQTLEKLVPTAAASYHQALQDLQDSERASWRGTCDELRETVREVLDHFAPDAQVMKAPGFALEKDRKGPTMSQKARFILKSRETPHGAMKSTQDAADRIEEGTAALARSVYDRGSMTSHRTTTRDEVKRLKLYVDALLTDLLAIQ